MKKISNYILIVIFSLLLGLFFINQLFPFISDTEYNENRKRAEKPKIDLRKLDAYPRKFEQYLSDNFSLRGFFLKHMSKVNSTIWKKSPLPDKVIVGKEGWLYSVDKELDCYYGKRNYSKQQLEEVLDEFSYRKQVLDTMGIQMAIVINPTKYSVYPEYLPSFFISENRVNSATQLIDFFREHSDIEIIYMKDYLMPLKEKYQLYYKNDNHWNEIGGYFASREMLRTLRDDIPDIPLEEFCRDTIKNRLGNLAHMTGNAEAYAETAVMLSLCEKDAQSFKRFNYAPPESFAYKSEYHWGFTSENDTLPDAVIIRDSYANALVPYLKNAFHNSTFIWDEWKYGFNLEIIEKEKPDIVIYMILESLIPNVYIGGLTIDREEL